MIQPVGNQSLISFNAKKYPIQEFDHILSGNSVVGKKTMETVEFDNGQYAVIGSRYEGIDIKDRIIYLYDETNMLIKTIVQTWFGGKKPNTVVINQKQLDKIV